MVALSFGAIAQQADSGTTNNSAKQTSDAGDDPVPVLAHGQSLGLAMDIPPIPNLRDAGGYKTADGRTVARGIVYRSDTFHPMTAEDISKLARLGLKNDYDCAPPPRPTPTRPDPRRRQVHTPQRARRRQIGSPAELEALLHDPKKANEVLGDGKIDDLFIGAYREFITLPERQEVVPRPLRLDGQPRQQPRRLPLHHRQGPHRLGVGRPAHTPRRPHETVVEDYMLSNTYILPQFQKEIDGFVAAGGDKEIVLAVFGVKRDYIEASFDEMQKQYGTIENYFSEGLGIDAETQGAIPVSTSSARNSPARQRRTPPGTLSCAPSGVARQRTPPRRINFSISAIP